MKEKNRRRWHGGRAFTFYALGLISNTTLKKKKKETGLFALKNTIRN